MKTNFKTLTIIFLMSLAFANTVKAQDKYEFMSIMYEPLRAKLNISVDGKFLNALELNIPRAEKELTNTSPLFLKVKEYQEKGWEVMTFNSSFANAFLHYAYLRKKIQ